MRKITEDSVNAFIAGRPMSKGNMSVTLESAGFGEPDLVVMRLHGNLIASRPVERGLYDTKLSNAGWWSNTTKERLHALLIAITNEWRLCSVQGEWVLWSSKHGEEKPFNGEVTIRELMDLSVTIASEKEERARVSSAAA